MILKFYVDFEFDFSWKGRKRFTCYIPRRGLGQLLRWLAVLLLVRLIFVFFFFQFFRGMSHGVAAVFAFSAERRV